MTRPFPPAAGAMRKSPSSRSLHVPKTMDRPSRLKAGSCSKRSSSRVRRRGSPSGKSRTQMRPSATYAARSPAGDTVTERSIFTSNSSRKTGCAERTAWATRLVVRTRKGIVSTPRDSMSMRLMRPSSQKTIWRESGVHDIAG